MFGRNLIAVWVGLILLSGMFLMGQDAWIEDYDYDLLVEVCQIASECPEIEATPEEIAACPAGIIEELNEDQLSEISRFSDYSIAVKECILNCIGDVICGRFGCCLSAISDSDVMEPYGDCQIECNPA